MWFFNLDNDCNIFPAVLLRIFYFVYAVEMVSKWIFNENFYN